jgi:hypothetical protein
MSRVWKGRDKPFVRLPKSRMVLVLAAIVVPLFLLLGLGYFIQAEWAAADRVSEVQRSILTQSGIPKDSIWAVEMNTDRVAEIVRRSSRYTELKVLQRAHETKELILQVVFVAFALSLIIVFLGVVAATIRYWEARGLPQPIVQLRRGRVRAVSAILLGLLITVLLGLQRYNASLLKMAEISFRNSNAISYHLYLTFGVALTGASLVQVAWASVVASRVGASINDSRVYYRHSATAIVIALALLLGATDLAGSYASAARGAILSSVGGVAFLYALGAGILGYLRQADAPPSATSHDRNPVDTHTKMDSDPQATQPTDAPRDAASEAQPSGDMAAQLSRSIILLETIDNRLVATHRRREAKATPPHPSDIVAQRGEAIKTRLLSEVQALNRRGDINLMIGSVTTLLAAGILGWLVLRGVPSHTDLAELMVRYYVPRISVAIFIEVFSFFFLRLYKSGLADIKYYQNELTNVESRLLALEVAALTNGSMELILRDLSSTDRNIVLKTGESTPDLEKLKVEQQGLKSIVDGLIAKIPEVKLK